MNTKYVTIGMTKIIFVMALIAMASALQSCSDEDNYSPYDDNLWENEWPYAWAVDSHGNLYSPDKSITDSEFAHKVSGKIWRRIASRTISGDLSSYSESTLGTIADGESMGCIYFDQDRCIRLSAAGIHLSSVTDAQWIYEEFPVEGRGEINHYIAFGLNSLLNIKHDNYLETISPQMTTEGMKYFYQVYQLDESLDLDEMMASAESIEILYNLKRAGQ